MHTAYHLRLPHQGHDRVSVLYPDHLLKLDTLLLLLAAALTPLVHEHSGQAERARSIKTNPKSLF